MATGGQHLVPLWIPYEAAILPDLSARFIVPTLFEPIKVTLRPGQWRPVFPLAGRIVFEIPTADGYIKQTALCRLNVDGTVSLPKSLGAGSDPVPFKDLKKFGKWEQ